jgi:hypothetical protein
MKALLPFAAILTSLATSVAASLSGGLWAKPAPITGDYVEARTASVMAGPCHYNGELVTTGRDALLAWNFTGGHFGGVDLAGVRAVAAVTADDNLSESAAHRTELAVDAGASEAQAAAVAALLRAKCGAQLGSIVKIRRAAISFTHGESGYDVDAAGFATLRVEYRADNSCCVQPNLVWYAPLSPVEQRKVGFTDLASYSGGISSPWSRQGEDSAFYGAIAF